MSLTEWVQRFIKYSDVIKKQITSIKVKNNIIFVYKKNREEKYYCYESLEKMNLNILDNDEYTYFICLNDKKNVEFLIKNWNSFVKNKKVNLIFVNIDKHEKWAINPYNHSLISDKKDLKQGLMSLYQGVL